MFNKRVLAIGNFDGVHAGHKAIFAETLRVAKNLGVTPAVLTFTPNPREFFFPATTPINIASRDEKIAAIGACGIHEIIEAQFDTGMASITAEQFAKDVLKKRLHALHVVTGENFVFGHKRGGNAALLAAWLKETGVGYSAVPAVKDAIGVLSSTRVREALVQGNMEEAAHVLGKPYTISGTVIHGHKRGKAMGFPTVNLQLAHRLLPKFGVYAVTIAAGKKTYKGVANIGEKPTFGAHAAALEAHAFHALPPLYGTSVTVALHHFIRPEQRFADAKSLIDQIAQDVLKAKTYLED